VTEGVAVGVSGPTGSEPRRGLSTPLEAQSPAFLTIQNSA